MLNKKARKLIGYENLVAKLADRISPAELDEMETDDLKKWLGAGFGYWEFKDWYRLLTDIKRRKRNAVHEAMTTEAIFRSLPWAAQQAGQAAVKILVEKAEENKLFQVDETAYAVTDILFDMFCCMRIDIKNTVMLMSRGKKLYTFGDMKESKMLWDFINGLRKIQWYRSGEVTRLREKNKC